MDKGMLSLPHNFCTVESPHTMYRVIKNYLVAWQMIASTCGDMARQCDMRIHYVSGLSNLCTNIFSDLARHIGTSSVIMAIKE